MPGFDKTGPEGQGSQTGRELGKCNPNKRKSNEQLDVNENGGRMRRRRGRGIGRRSGSGKGLGRGLGRRAGYSN
jgi:hypothetical protein